MRNWLVCAALASSSVWAGNIDLEFTQVPISQLAHAVVKGILKQDYVISPEAATVDSKVTLSVHGLDNDGVKTTLNDVLQGVGLQVMERRGVIYLEKRQSVASDAVPSSSSAVAVPKAPDRASDAISPDENVEVYFPKFRGADYLQLAVRAAGCRPVDGSSKAAQGQGGAVMSPYFGQSSMFGSSGQSQQYGHMAQPAAVNLWKDVLVYAGNEKCFAKVEKLLAQLDRPSVALQLRGAILEVTDTSENVRSVQAILSLLAGKLQLGINAGTAVGNTLTLNSVTLQGVLSAVQGDTRFRSLSEPSLRVVEGETAKLTIGQDVPVRGAVTSGTNGTIIQSIEYKTGGLVFEVTPTVYQDVLRLKIGHQISSFTSTTTSGIDSPTKITREASTVVQAHDGELIAIGGLDETRETNSTSGLSFLPSFLRGRNDSSSKSQILLLLEVRKQPLTTL